MLMPARQVRAGDHLDGATVLWVGVLTYSRTLAIALDAEVPDDSGRVSRLRRYDPDQLVEVHPSKATSAP
jgi:hypothetical protein